jgi:hypothetical protein
MNTFGERNLAEPIWNEGYSEKCFERLQRRKQSQHRIISETQMHSVSNLSSAI